MGFVQPTGIRMRPGDSCLIRSRGFLLAPDGKPEVAFAGDAGQPVLLARASGVHADVVYRIGERTWPSANHWQTLLARDEGPLVVELVHQPASRQREVLWRPQIGLFLLDILRGGAPAR